jgi:regulatory protein
VHIESSEQRGANGHGVLVTLEDGSSFFVLPDLAEHLDLQPGAECDPDELGEVSRKSQARIARDRAYGFLARREHSSQQLEEKLRHRGIPEEVIGSTLAELRESGALSDLRFAESWVRTRLRRNPEGRQLLRAGLRRRGVSNAVAEQALAAVQEEWPEGLDEAVDRALERIRRRNPGDTLEKLKEKLIRRGFSLSEVREAISRAEPGETDAGR